HFWIRARGGLHDLGAPDRRAHAVQDSARRRRRHRGDQYRRRGSPQGARRARLTLWLRGRVFPEQLALEPDRRELLRAVIVDVAHRGPRPAHVLPEFLEELVTCELEMPHIAVLWGKPAPVGEDLQ